MENKVLSSQGYFNYSFCFTDPSGNVHPEIINEKGNPSYKYFYTNAEQGRYGFGSNRGPDWMATTKATFKHLLIH